MASDKFCVCVCVCVQRIKVGFTKKLSVKQLAKQRESQKKPFLLAA